MRETALQFAFCCYLATKELVVVSVFISYAKEDGKEATDLHRLLTLFGFKCFLAHKDIPKGEQWRDEIVKAIRAAHVFIPLLSARGLVSAWVQQECGMAHLLAESRRRRPVIIPIIPGRQTPPGCMSEYQGLSVRKTLWFGRLTLTPEVASSLAGAILQQIPRVDEVKAKAMSNLKVANLNEFVALLTFLHSIGKLEFAEFQLLISHATKHSSVYRSDAAMNLMYAILQMHIDELKEHPDWVEAWNHLHERYQSFKAEERRRQEENARRLREEMAALQSRDSDDEEKE